MTGAAEEQEMYDDHAASLLDISIPAVLIQVHRDHNQASKNFLDWVTKTFKDSGS